LGGLENGEAVFAHDARTGYWLARLDGGFDF
jgi:hypothetical protein